MLNGVDAPCQIVANCNKFVAAFCRLLSTRRIRASPASTTVRGWCHRFFACGWRRDECEIFALNGCSGMFLSTFVNASAGCCARESGVPLWVAGLRVKVVSPCCPDCSTVDSQPGSRIFARRNRAQEIVSRRIVMLEWQPSILLR